ncbi:MAG: class I SAM-dependent methyltransferase [Acidimicrobiales bacterium]
MVHENRARAESFGARAKAYDRYRPTYPEAIIDDLVAGGRPRVLDVGCGTGKAARLFAERGCEVLGIEIDERMAEVARTHGIRVEVAPFESWEPDGRSFDLVTAGQAWHWVDPEVAPKKAADVLASNGRIAVFWNHGSPYDPDFETAIEEAAAGRAGDRFGGPKGPRERHDISWHADAIGKSGRFSPCEVRSYTWQMRLTNEDWLALWPTWSEIAVMSEPERAALLSDVSAVLQRFGDEILFDYETECITAVRVN